jgi:type I restriction enzyme M protein
MNEIANFKEKIKKLIDDLKSVCRQSGLGNDGDEYKIITQVFLYKFFNDKFIFEAKKIDKDLSKLSNIEKELQKYSKKNYEKLILQLNENIAILKPENLISNIYHLQNQPNFASIFDDNLIKIANDNNDIFAVLTAGGQKITIFQGVSKFVSDNKDEFCRAIINKISNYSFENIFNEKFDFFADIFEHLIKDYNSDSGGTYAEYFTPHAVSKIMAECLVKDKDKNVTCYDPSAGSGTLLMNLSHVIGEDRCTIYSQDISQKSSNLLRLNLILNNLVHSIPNIVQGDTIEKPFHKNGNEFKKFDYIVSNPPFKLDFSDNRENLASAEHAARFFAGVPSIPKKDKKKMPIYTMFIQHVYHVLSEKGRASIVVPTGFLTAQSGVQKKIREFLIDKKVIIGAISMPSNIFAKTGTNVSIIFLDKKNQDENVILIDASNLGSTINQGEGQKTLLTTEEENIIIKTFKNRKNVDALSVSASYKEIKDNYYSLSAGQYFDIEIENIDISEKQFKSQIELFKKNIQEYDKEATILKEEVFKNLSRLNLKDD